MTRFVQFAEVRVGNLCRCVHTRRLWSKTTPWEDEGWWFNADDCADGGPVYVHPEVSVEEIANDDYREAWIDKRWRITLPRR